MAPTMEQKRCQCGCRASKFCHGCDLLYCEACAVKRHAKGAFRRHTIMDNVHDSPLVGKQDNYELNNLSMDANSIEYEDDDEVCSVCDECIENNAVLWCTACELNFCGTCSQAVHKVGTMQSHLEDGKFQFLTNNNKHQSSHNQQSSPRSSTASPDRSPLAKRLDHEGKLPASPEQEPHIGIMSEKISGLKTHLIREQAPLIDANENDTPDSPRSTARKNSDMDSYDLWSGWSVRSFTDRSSSIESASQWRNPRSMSIDSKASSGMSDDDLSLQSISESLQSLSFVPPASQGSPLRSETSTVFASRARSYSDYTSLRSSNSLADLWQDQTKSRSPQPSISAFVTELWNTMKTNFASRHVVVRSSAGFFDVDDIQRIQETLNNFGSLARSRAELVREGLLFFTFFELKCAIGAVKAWTSDMHSSTGSSVSLLRGSHPFPVINFCLPYELPDETNCATLLVQLSGQPISSMEMRQFCSRFGEVASVLQNEAQSNKYIVEYNDSRDLSQAMAELSCCFHASGPILVARTVPPTLDMAKIQSFNETIGRLNVCGSVRDRSSRPKSFSSTSTTSLLTSPTSSSSSTLNASFLDTSSTGAGEMDITTNTSITSSRTLSPFTASIAVLSENSKSLGTLSPSGLSVGQDYIWANNSVGSGPRARSSSSSHIGMVASSSSPSLSETSSLTMAPGYSNAFPATSASQNLYGTSNLPTQQHYHHGNHSSRNPGLQHYRPTFQHRIMNSPGIPSKYGPVRTGSDPCFRMVNNFSNTLSNQAGHSGGATYSIVHAMNGRNDRGSGEFCLSIDRVLSGEDTRTTLMIRNIPNKYTQQMLLAEINQNHRGNYDFFYLPIDFKNKCNMGYAFINFMEPASIVPFYKEFDSQKWTNFNSEKVCAISYARLQGKQAMITRFQNSSLLEKHESYRPLVFVSSGPNRGKPELFPSPKQPHQKKQFVHGQHHLIMGCDEYTASALAHLYVQNPRPTQQHFHQHHHHQQQQLHPFHNHLAHHLLGTHQHYTGGMQGVAAPSNGGLNLNFHGGSLHQQPLNVMLPSHQPHNRQMMNGGSGSLLFGAPSGATGY